MRATDLSKPIEAWTNRHWSILRVLGYVLAFAVIFGGTALAAYHSDSTITFSAVCGALMIGFVRLYTRAIPPVQRLIERLHPELDDPAKPDGIPGWAVGGYLLIGLAFAIGALEETYTNQ